MLNMLPLYATCGTESLLQAIGVLREMNQKAVASCLITHPHNLSKAVAKLIHTDNGINVNYYELCVLSELKTPYVQATFGCKAHGNLKPLMSI